MYFSSFVDQSPEMQVLLYTLIIIAVLLVGANAANLVLAVRSIPGPLADRIRACLIKNDYDGLWLLADSHPDRISRCFKSGLKSGPDGMVLDKAAVIASWQALIKAFLLLPQALKAFALMALALAGAGMGIELVRLYSNVYTRIDTTLGYIPLRELFQQGSARIVVLGLIGLAVFVTTLVGGFLFSGLVRMVLARRTSSLVDLFSETGKSSGPHK